MVGRLLLWVMICKSQDSVIETANHSGLTRIHFLQIESSTISNQRKKKWKKKILKYIQSLRFIKKKI